MPQRPVADAWRQGKTGILLIRPAGQKQIELARWALAADDAVEEGLRRGRLGGKVNLHAAASVPRPSCRGVEKGGKGQKKPVEVTVYLCRSMGTVPSRSRFLSGFLGPHNRRKKQSEEG
jgi:hypothetical protein